MLYNSVTTNNSFNFAKSFSKNELIVAIDENQSGYSIINGQPAGFLYDILDAYCKDNSLKLTIVPKASDYYATEMLEDGNVDIVSLTSIDKNQLNIHNLAPTLSSKFVVVVNKLDGKKRGYSNNLKPLPTDGDVVIAQNFTLTKEYTDLAKSTDNKMTLSYESPHELMSQLVNKRFEYLICNDFDAVEFIKNDNRLKITHLFTEEVSQFLSINVQNKGLEVSFNDWFNNFVISQPYADISARYLSDTHIEYSTPNIISDYDYIIKSQSKSLGFDWRFVSAIAYNESRFKPEVCSSKGATGLMQIMPRIARHYNMDASQIQKPENNVEVALRLLLEIERTLKLPETTLEHDKLALMLACYNGGIGHVSDARRLAKKYGADPNKWDSVSKFLSAKQNAKYYNDEVVKHGSFVGTETTGFVSKVLARYDFYCQMASL